MTYYPNGLSQPDRRNNAERVIINGVTNNDVATITVTAYNLARYEQKYSVVGMLLLVDLELHFALTISSKRNTAASIPCNDG